MRKLVCSLAIIASSLLAVSTQAEISTGNAQVNILSAFTFSETQIVDFKYIPGDDGVCTMAASGVLSGQCAGQPDGTPGQFIATGIPSQTVDISVSAGSTSGGVSYTPILASNNLQADTAILDGSGDVTINVIGNLTLASATNGAKALTYLLGVYYQ